MSKLPPYSEILEVTPRMVPLAATQIARDLRPLDRIECESTGLRAEDALRDLLAKSVIAEAFWEGGVGFGAAWGYWPESFAGSRRAYGWFVGTPCVDRYPRKLITYTKETLRRALGLYPEIEANALARYTRSITFLKHMGFVLEGDLIVGTDKYLRMVVRA